MDAETFNKLFAQQITSPLASIGAVQDEQSLFWESSNLTVALLRTETGSSAPPKLTLFVRHKAMRDLDAKMPNRSTRRPNDYPYKMLPGDIGALLALDCKYTPLNLGEYPADAFSCPPDSPEQIQQRLAAIAVQLLAALPQLDQLLTAERMLTHLVDEGENAPAELLWIEDLRAIVS